MTDKQTGIGAPLSSSDYMRGYRQGRIDGHAAACRELKELTGGALDLLPPREQPEELEASG